MHAGRNSTDKPRLNLAENLLTEHGVIVGLLVYTLALFNSNAKDFEDAGSAKNAAAAKGQPETAFGDFDPSDEAT